MGGLTLACIRSKDTVKFMHWVKCKSAPHEIYVVFAVVFMRERKKKRFMITYSSWLASTFKAVIQTVCGVKTFYQFLPC